MKIVSRVAAIGITGWIGGVLTEKVRSHYNLLESQVDAAAVIKDPSATVSSGVVPIPPSAGSDVRDSFGSGYYPDKQSRMSQIMRFGFPGMDNIRSFDDFVVSYDRRNRVPHWVFEHMTRYTVKYNQSVDRSKCEFFEDGSIHPFFRATNKDFKGSGYDRGHLAAAGNHRMCQQHCEQTFVLSNMAPQVGKGFNRDAWNRLEKYVRGLTKTYDNVYVCTGPLYLPRRESNGKNYVRYEVIGGNNVAVPTHFYKIIVGEFSQSGQLDMEAYMMPNEPIDDNAPVSYFQVPVESIERAAGFIFFDRVPKNVFRQINGRKSSFLKQ